MKTASKDCFELIRHFESLHDGDLSKIGLQPKLDPSGIVTVGYGHALKNHKTGEWLRDVTEVSKYYPQFVDMTAEDAEDLLKTDIRKFESIVNSKIKKELSQNQFDALVSYTFNTGGSANLFLYINNYSENVIKEWWTEHYITSNGKTLSGLIRRRKSEYELYSTGKLNFFE